MLIKAVVDRFEGNKAVMLIGDEEAQAVWPRKFLPTEVAEGDILQINFQIDNEATNAAKAEAKQLLEAVLSKK